MRSSLIVLVICGAFLSVQAHAEGPSRKPENLTMTLAWIADAKEPNQHLFVINGVVAYRTLDGLKKYIKRLPKDPTLTWAPDCDLDRRIPLNSSEERKVFAAFCTSCGVKFVLVPSGCRLPMFG